MAQDLELALRIKADIKQALDGLEQVVDGLRDTANAGKDAGKGLGTAGKDIQKVNDRLRDTANAGAQAGKGAREAARGIDAVGRSAKQASPTVVDLYRKVRNLWAVYASVRAVQGLVRITDQYQQLRGQLALVTESEEELADTERALFDLAQRTRSGYAETVTLYARMARSAKELHLSQRDLLGVTETINQAIQVSGASAQEAAAGVIQFAQGLAAGALRGEELNSVTEQMPRLMEAIIQGVQKVNPQLGLTRQNYRDLAAEGKLTTELIIAALQSQADTVAREFARLPRTGGRALTQLRNDFDRSLKDADMRPLVDAIDDLRDTVTDPAFQKGISDLASGLVRIVSIGGEAAAEFGRFGRLLGRFAAELTGNLSPLDQIEAEIEDIDVALRNSWLFKPAKYLNTTKEELERIRAQLIAEREALLAAQGLVSPKPGAPAATPAGASRAGGTKPAAPSDDFLEAQADLERRIAMLGRETATEQMLWEVEKGRYKDLEGGEKTALIALARRLDAGTVAIRQAEEQRKAEEAARLEQERYDQELERAARAIRDMLDPMESQRRELAQLDELLARGKLSWDEWAEATLRVHERMDELHSKVEETGTKSNEYAIQAARNIQSAFADFLFDPFEDGLKGMLRGFADIIRRMIAEAMAARLAEKLFGDFAKTGLLGGWIGGVLNAVVHHSGGIAGSSAAPVRAISPLAFAGAPRYHSGGIAGLAPDEVPAILRRGEEVLTADDPRHRANGGGQGVGVRIINVIDPALAADYLNSAAGEKTILNVLSRNGSAVRELLR